ncbi:unnamed protein product [Orchesella dallaii]|uniref:Gustatory receptor n=1 Tax=Orchesella dallaii TaxID=48710 RepID=A0ABP1S6P6_9HEXA
MSYLIAKVKSELPAVLHQTSVWQLFIKWAKLAKWLGFFPLRIQDLTPDQGNLTSRRRTSLFAKIFSLPLIYCLVLYLLSSMFILFPMRLYIADYVKKDLKTKLQSTDRFALQTFLVCIYLIRVTCPFFLIYQYASIMAIVQSLQRHDKKFQIKANTIKFMDWPMLALFVSCVFVMVSNFIASRLDFVDFIIRNNKLSWILQTLSFNNKYVASALMKASHAHAEFSTAFLIGVMRYISKFVENRVVKLAVQLQEMECNTIESCLQKRKKFQHQHFHHQYLSLPNVHESSSVPNGKEKTCCVNILEVDTCGNLELKEFKSLHDIVKQFNYIFRSCILNFFILTILLTIVSIYLVVMILRSVSVAGGMHIITKMKVLRGFNALGVTGFHSIFRILLIINVGERIQMAGKNLLTTVSLIDVTNISAERSAKVKELRWVLNGCRFAVKPWNAFTLNRRLIVSILGSVITFVVILTQFRATDPELGLELMEDENPSQEFDFQNKSSETESFVNFTRS